MAGAFRPNWNSRRLPGTTGLGSWGLRPDDAVGLEGREMMRASLETGSGEETAPTGASLPFEPLFHPEPGPSAVRDLSSERSPHVRVEEAMAVNERRYRSLVEATAAIVWNTPASGEFEADQPGWSDFTGQSFEQLSGMGLAGRRPPRGPTEYRPRLVARRRGPDPIPGGAPAPPPRRRVSRHVRPRRPAPGRRRHAPRVGGRAHRHHQAGPHGGGPAPEPRTTHGRHGRLRYGDVPLGHAQRRHRRGRAS